MVKEVRVVYSLIPHVFIPLPFLLDSKSARIMGGVVKTDTGEYRFRPLKGEERLGAYVLPMVLFLFFLFVSLGSMGVLLSLILSVSFPVVALRTVEDLRLEFLMLGMALVGSVLLFGLSGALGVIEGATTYLSVKVCSSFERKLFKTEKGVLFLIEEKER